jgi:hypothetical protein
MKIRIVNYESGKNNGILSKYAQKMKEGLKKLGHDISISPEPDPVADVNHHINYWPYKFEKSPKTINTLMVTHITTETKFKALKKGMETAEAGICMSGQTKEELEEKGVKNLSVILPAHDGHFKPKIIAILTNVYPDGCKRQWMFSELAKTIDKNKFIFFIMGTGWQPILEPLINDGVQINYIEKFDYNSHIEILSKSEYSLYFGEDEGSMGILDSASCGLKTIAPPVGFHREIGIDYPFRTQDELNEIFRKLAENLVSEWTWDKYAKEHEKIWKQIIEKSANRSLSHEGEVDTKKETVKDGINHIIQIAKSLLWKVAPVFFKEFYKKFAEKHSVMNVEKYLKKKP